MSMPTVRANARIVVDSDGHGCDCEFCDEPGDEYLEVDRSGWVARCCSASKKAKELPEAVEWLADHLDAEHGMTPRTMVAHGASLCGDCEGKAGDPRSFSGVRLACSTCEDGIVFDDERTVVVAEMRLQAATIRAQRAEREAKAS